MQTTKPRLGSSEHAQLLKNIRRTAMCSEIRSVQNVAERAALLVKKGVGSRESIASVLRVDASAVRRAEQALQQGRSVGRVGRNPALPDDVVILLKKWCVSRADSHTWATTAEIANQVSTSPLFSLSYLLNHLQARLLLQKFAPQNLRFFDLGESWASSFVHRELVGYRMTKRRTMSPVHIPQLIPLPIVSDTSHKGAYLVARRNLQLVR